MRVRARARVRACMHAYFLCERGECARASACMRACVHACMCVFVVCYPSPQRDQVCIVTQSYSPPPTPNPSYRQWALMSPCQSQQSRSNRSTPSQSHHMSSNSTHPDPRSTLLACRDGAGARVTSRLCAWRAAPCGQRARKPPQHSQDGCACKEEEQALRFPSTSHRKYRFRPWPPPTRGPDAARPRRAAPPPETTSCVEADDQ